MDQLKPYLAALNRNRFWILSGIVVITAIIVWNSASGAVNEKFVKDKGTNDRAFTSLGMFRSNQMNKLPNTEFKSRVDGLRDQLEVGVMEAWEALFRNQEPVFPVNDRIENLKQYLVDEKYLDVPIPSRPRELYRDLNLVEEDFAKVFSVLNLRRYNGADPVDASKVGNPDLPPEGLVVWAASPAPRDLMLRYKTRDVLSSDRIRMLHEDMWVFRSMFTVISRINSKPIDVWLQILEGGTPSDAPVDQANLPIKQIDYCDLAQYAMSASEGRPGYVELAGEDPNRPGGMGKKQGGKGQSSFSVGTVGNALEDEKLKTGRYIDGRNMPVADPAAPPFKEFKQIFVQMEFVMDQRMIPVLIAECANAPIIIETRQVLVDLDEVDVARVVDAGEAARAVNKIEQSPHDVRVTLRGVVYGYSPPKKENLGTGTDPEPSKRDYGIPKKAVEVQTF